MPPAGEHSNAHQTIGQVVDLLSSEFPDVTHSSLRFLEREGLIEPARTAGGHRLFPPDQIERIRVIKNWQNQRLSLEEIKQRFDAIDQLPDLSSIASRLLEHLIEGNREAAQELVLQIDETGMPLETIFDEIIRPVLWETGERWAREELPVGQEKEISAFTRDLIASLGPRHAPEGRDAGPVLVAACVEGENHELGLRMITALLRERGYIVYYLGPSVSPDFLIERVVARQPVAVLLSAICGERLPALADAVASLHEAPGLASRPAIIVGGGGVPPEWQPDDPNHTVVVTRPDLSQTVSQIDNILREPATTG